jgi:L-threonylcarbamoyladenylate synthase
MNVLDSPFHEDIERCLNTLGSGGLILYPTDTVWGIGCDATNKDAVQKIFALKRRPDSKSLIILVASEKEIANYVLRPDPRVFNYLKTIQKPTTIIYDGAFGLPDNVIHTNGSVAIRIVQEEFCDQLIRLYGKPIVSSSANISGKPVPGNFKLISNEIKDGVDYVVKYRQEDTKKSQSSSIVTCNKDGTITVLRS